MNTGEKIRQLRIHKKMTQGNLVEGISSVTYLSRIENGKIKPSHGFLKQVSKRLKISIDDLAHDNISSKEERILSIFNHFKLSNRVSEEGLSFLSINSKEAHPPNTLIQIYGILIRHYLNNKDMEQAEKMYTLSNHVIPNYIQDRDFDSSIYYYISCGIYFYHKQLYEQADHYFTKAESIMEHNETIESAKLYYNISLVKQRVLEDKTLALQYAKKAYTIFAELKENEMMAKVLITLGVQHHLKKDYEQSLICLNKAKEIINDSDKMLTAMIEYNRGRVYQGLRSFEKAINSYEKSIEINEELNIIEEKIYSLRSLAEIYIEKKHWNQVENNLSEAFEIAERFDLHYMLIELGSMKARIYEIRGDYTAYEKEMQRNIEKGIELKQHVLVKKMAREFGDYFYKFRANKKAADFFKMALDNDV